MSEYFKQLCSLLESENWKEPTKEEYHTYLSANKKNGNKSKAPYFEDIHYAWRNYKPNCA